MGILGSFQVGFQAKIILGSGKQLNEFDDHKVRHYMTWTTFKNFPYVHCPGIVWTHTLMVILFKNRLLCKMGHSSSTWVLVNGTNVEKENVIWLVITILLQQLCILNEIKHTKKFKKNLSNHSAIVLLQKDS